MPFKTSGVLLSVVFACACTAASVAQLPSPAWRGTVQDEQEKLIPNATVELRSKGIQPVSVTAKEGRFRFDTLPAQTYSVRVVVNGRDYVSKADLKIPSQMTAVLLTVHPNGTFTLAPEQETAAGGGEQLSSKTVSEIPLNKRDFSQLLLLAAGTAADPSGASNFTQQFAINGQRGVEATFAMDGADISDPEQGGGTFTNFNTDAVSEIQSLSGVMPAEVGRGASGLTSIVTRSGEQGFHGSIFEFIRNSSLDARNYFDYSSPASPGRIPPFRRNEFGFTNGGPVFIPRFVDGRGKFFYFLEYQGFVRCWGRLRSSPFQRPRSVPDRIQPPSQVTP